MTGPSKWLKPTNTVKACGPAMASAPDIEKSNYALVADPSCRRNEELCFQRLWRDRGWSLVRWNGRQSDAPPLLAPDSRALLGTFGLFRGSPSSKSRAPRWWRSDHPR